MEWIEINEDSIRYFHFKWVAIIKIYWMIKEQKAWTINDNNKWRCNKLRRTIFILKPDCGELKTGAESMTLYNFSLPTEYYNYSFMVFVVTVLTSLFHFTAFKWGTVGDIENPVLIFEITRTSKYEFMYHTFYSKYDGFTLYHMNAEKYYEISNKNKH